MTPERLPAPDLGFCIRACAYYACIIRVYILGGAARMRGEEALTSELFKVRLLHIARCALGLLTVRDLQVYHRKLGNIFSFNFRSLFE